MLRMSGCGLLQGHEVDSSPAVVVDSRAGSVRAGATQQFTAEVNSGRIASGHYPGAGSLAPPSRKVDTVDPQMRRPEPNAAVSSGQVTWSVNDVAGGNATLGTIECQGTLHRAGGSPEHHMPSRSPRQRRKSNSGGGASHSHSGDRRSVAGKSDPGVQEVQPDPVAWGSSRSRSLARSLLRVRRFFSTAPRCQLLSSRLAN